MKDKIDLQRHSFLKSIDTIREKHRLAVTLLIIASMFTISYLDLITKEEIFFFPFYLVPIFLTAICFNLNWTLMTLVFAVFLNQGVIFLEVYYYPDLVIPHNILNNILIFVANGIAAVSFHHLFAYLEKASYYEDYIQNIVSHIPYGLLSIDKDGKIVKFNPAASAITGYEGEEVIGKSTETINKLFASQNEENTFLKGSASENAQKDPTEYAIKNKNGDEITILNSSAPIYQKGQIIGQINIFRDISKEKELERVRQEMLSVLSHDLRTPLTAIIGYSDILTHKTLTREEQTEFLEDISASARTMVLMLENMLEDARQNDGRAVFYKENFDFSALSKSVVKMLGSLAREKNIEMKNEVAEGLQVYGDREKIRQVMNNLISNAIKYSKHECTVTIRARSEGGKLTIQIIDDGPGIPEEFIPRLFDRFSRVNGRKNGSGLGLYIVKKIVENHEGQIAATSKLGSGTTFTFDLPKAKEETTP